MTNSAKTAASPPADGSATIADAYRRFAWGLKTPYRMAIGPDAVVSVGESGARVAALFWVNSDHSLTEGGFEDAARSMLAPYAEVRIDVGASVCKADGGAWVEGGVWIDEKDVMSYFWKHILPDVGSRLASVEAEDGWKEQSASILSHLSAEESIELRCIVGIRQLMLTQSDDRGPWPYRVISKIPGRNGWLVADRRKSVDSALAEVPESTLLELARQHAESLTRADFAQKLGLKPANSECIEKWGRVAEPRRREMMMYALDMHSIADGELTPCPADVQEMLNRVKYVELARPGAFLENAWLAGRKPNTNDWIAHHVLFTDASSVMPWEEVYLRCLRTAHARGEGLFREMQGIPYEELSGRWSWASPFERERYVSIALQHLILEADSEAYRFEDAGVHQHRPTSSS